MNSAAAYLLHTGIMCCVQWQHIFPFNLANTYTHVRNVFFVNLVKLSTEYCLPSHFKYLFLNTLVALMHGILIKAMDTRLL